MGGVELNVEDGKLKVRSTGADRGWRKEEAGKGDTGGTGSRSATRRTWLLLALSKINDTLG